MPRRHRRVELRLRRRRGRVGAASSREAAPTSVSKSCDWRIGLARYASNSRSSSPASRRPSELNSTSGSAARRSRICRASVEAVHLRHVHVEDRDVERLALARASAALPSAIRSRATACPTSPSAARARGGWSRCRRRSAARLPASSGCTPTKSRRARGGSSAGRHADREEERRALAGPVALAPTSCRPSARRGAC